MNEQELEHKGWPIMSEYNPGSEIVYLPKGARLYRVEDEASTENEQDKIQPLQEGELAHHSQRYGHESAITPRFAHQAITPKVWTLVLEVCIGLAKYEPTFVPGSPRACNFCKFTDVGLDAWQDFPHAPSCPVTFARVLCDVVGGE